jgi:hypothetical protein
LAFKNFAEDACEDLEYEAIQLHVMKEIADEDFKVMIGEHDKLQMLNSLKQRLGEVVAEELDIF